MFGSGSVAAFSICTVVVEVHLKRASGSSCFCRGYISLIENGYSKIIVIITLCVFYCKYDVCHYDSAAIGCHVHGHIMFEM